MLGNLFFEKTQSTIGNTSKDFNDLCKEAGIKRELIVPCNPQQNGVEERKNRSIVEVVKEIKSHLSNHEVAVRVLEPAEYQVISEEAQEWGVFIKTPTGPI